MQRLLTSLTLVGLLVATAAAFAITERLKLTKSAISGTHVSTAFSPKCSCARSHANVRIVLRRADRLSVEVIDARRREVAILLGGQPFRRGEAKFRWDGRTDAGGLAPDGVYHVKIHLARQHQTIVLPNAIRLDTKPPEVDPNVVLNRGVFSPDGDHQADFVRLTYRLSKPAHVLVYLGGRRVLESYRHPATGSISWRGTVDHRVLGPGHYTLEVGAIDAAGNVTPVGQRVRVHVQIRYIALAARRIVARSGKRFEIGVSTDAKHYAWQLGKRKGRGKGPVLRLLAPTQVGLYTLTVTERGHVDRAHVVVK